MTKKSEFSNECSNNTDAQICSNRRKVIKITAAAALTGLPLDFMQAIAAVPEDLRPQRGDRLVQTGSDSKSKPLKLDDIKIGAKPMHVFPIDVTSKTVRDGSRFNKVLLIRIDPSQLDEETLKRSVSGVLAFSSICTHEGCDVTEWVANEKALLCFCHFSKFSPFETGRVISGPATRSLPYLPLELSNDELTVAGPFSAAPGTKKSR
jgi:rieske iron-sulfur protein